MKEKLRTDFLQRQHMVSRDFEIYYYNNRITPPRVEMHAHDYFEFYFFVEGNVEMIIGEDSFRLQDGDIILIPPGISHKVVVRNMDIPYRRFVFWISLEYSQQLEELSPDMTYLKRQVEERGEYIFHNDAVTANAIQSRVLRLLEEQQGERFGRDVLIGFCVNELILYLNRLIYERRHPSAGRNPEELYQNVVVYIERNLEEDLSLDALAREFYVSKYHISHMFKNHLGISVHQFITKRRLAACREAILGGASITKVYRMYGFGDYSCFYRAFKKEYGVSPKDCQDMKLVCTE